MVLDSPSVRTVDWMFYAWSARILPSADDDDDDDAGSSRKITGGGDEEQIVDAQQ